MGKGISFVIWALVPIVLLAITYFFPKLLNNEIIVQFIPSYILFIGRLAYDKFDLFALSINKFVLFSLNKSVKWGIKAIYQFDESNEINQSDFNNCVLRIKNVFTDYKIWVENDNKFIVKLSDGGTFKLEFYNIPTNIEGEKSITLDISIIQVPFRESKKRINYFAGLIQKIFQEIICSNKKYQFQLKFEGTNPYFGLFVKRVHLPEKQEIMFNIEFNEEIGVHKGKISINSKDMNIITSDLQSLQELSKKYLSLSQG